MKQIRVIILWTCLFLFFARVLGQILVGIYANTGILSYLPSWGMWYSGLLPYPVLLIAQMLIIPLLTLMAYDFTRNQGFFSISKPKVKVTIRYLAIVYFLSMIVRFFWFRDPHTIPTLFHCVLALFLFTYSFSLIDSADRPNPANQ